MTSPSTIRELREAGYAALPSMHVGGAPCLTVTAPFPFWLYDTHKAISPEAVMASITEASGANGGYGVTFFAPSNEDAPSGFAFLTRAQFQKLESSFKSYQETQRAVTRQHDTFMQSVRTASSKDNT